MRPARSTRSFCVHRFDVLSRPKAPRKYASLRAAIKRLVHHDAGFRSFRRVTGRIWSAGGYGQYAFAHTANSPCPEAWTP